MFNRNNFGNKKKKKHFRTFRRKLKENKNQTDLIFNTY